ncbi:hypothetical protein A3860_23565 [Niastella vici]|uniref:Starch-binding protein n=1 Tax=Niastella vici TaxID=1703345 RepID=A0A1V9FZW6_9BACT|nr:RagB/SusD family nutrient uptake outer membrane protein [Niastella vici]OQP63911.1 hypothetical protein A3860_23565 [Niastella vici]
MKNVLSIIWAVAIAIPMFICGCNKILDKEPMNALDESKVWANATAATAFLDTVYYNLMPGMAYGTGNPGGCSKGMNNWFWGGWNANSDLVQYGNYTGTDEACPTDMETSRYLLGTATYDWLENYDRTDVAEKWAMKNYGSIRNINQILAKIDGATFDDASKKAIKGQALFFRAWAYHAMVKDVGGMPLILTPQPVGDLADLQQPRNKTSECVTQILKDLDDAIALLPDSWGGRDAGRIDKGAAMAFKGRVLLFYASPLFNGLGGIATWQKAYDANLAAKNFLDSKGKGLYPVFGKIWDDEMNKEVIMVRRFNYPDSYYPAPGFVPLFASADDWESDCPSWELIRAFPMKDGSAFNPVNADDFAKYFINRDDRFYATILYNGAPVMWSEKWKKQNVYNWSFLQYGEIDANNNAHDKSSGKYKNDLNQSWSGLTDLSPNCTYRAKAVDKIAPDADHSATDWPEIRYAEVLLNLAEAAYESGNISEVLGYLTPLRKRAGIAAGSGNYGIDVANLRKAIHDERFVELAFENKRWDDLRRWKAFGDLRSLGKRHGFAILLKAGESMPGKLDDIYQPSVYTKFSCKVVNGDKAPIAIQDNQYLFGLPYSILQRNPKLQQSIAWGGSFNPFQ